LEDAQQKREGGRIINYVAIVYDFREKCIEGLDFRIGGVVDSFEKFAYYYLIL